MARKKGKRSGGGRRGIRIGATVGILAGGYAMYKFVQGTTGENKAVRAVMALTGYNYKDGTFNWKDARFTIPAVAGMGLSMAASKIGLNRYTPKGINL